VLAGVRPHLMVTDPPYGVAYDPEWRNRAGVSTTRRTGKVENDDRADWRDAWALFPGDVAYVWHGALHATTVAESLTSCGFDIRAQIIWAKDRRVLGRGHYHWQHEPAWYAVRGQGHWSAIASRRPCGRTKTLRKHFRDELDRGMTEANAKVAQSLFQMATQGKNVAAAILWMKARAGWREKIEIRPEVTPHASLTDAKLEAIVRQGESPRRVYNRIIEGTPGEEGQ